MRELSDGERRALVDLSTGMSDDERARFLADIQHCRVSEATADGSRLSFHIPGYERPPYLGQHAYTVGGTVRDCDGAEISVSIYADQNHRLLELELVKWGNAQLVKPDWNTFFVKY